MKAWWAVAVLWACWISRVEPRPPIYKVKFSATYATQSTYVAFITDLVRVLMIHGSASHGIPVLPASTMPPTDLHRYVVVELSMVYDRRIKTVSLVIDAVNVYILGYHPGGGAVSYFFNDVAQDVRQLFFDGTERQRLHFDGSYGNLAGVAGAGRGKIKLGFDKLCQKINDLNRYTPVPGDVEYIAKALIVCIEMVPEAARFKFIMQQIAALAPAVPGGNYSTLLPDTLMQGYQNNWGQLSSAIQMAKPDGTFRKTVAVTTHLSYSNVASVRPVITILLKASPTTCSATTVLDRVTDAGFCSK
ncbi:hypothetical protein V6N13_055568 [Hibiscus sabdariffa]|uniref:Uncharacterized protein n=2 Tax=Hibiscus sabdariffa TaxID=183260 RepID=A0ABR2BLY9_9ROSI